LIRELARRPGGRHILNILSNGRDTQLRMPVGKRSKYPEKWTDCAGTHEQEFMNFLAKEV